MQTTLTIVKPDAVAAGNAGNILAHLEREGFTFRGVKMLRLSQEVKRLASIKILRILALAV